MAEPDFLELHNFLASDIIRTREGGTGWMIDLAMNANRCNPKTFLLKTKKCDRYGSIVLEPALSPENYINPKSEGKSGGFFSMFTSNSTNISINESLSEESVRTTVVSEASAVSQHKYACIKSTDYSGRVRFHIAPNAGFGASMTGTKSMSSSVEVFCEDLVTKSVDFEDLRSTFDKHTVNITATNIRGENSLFVITDVIVAGKISWQVKQNVESKKRGGGKVEAEPVNVEAEGGTLSQRPEEHRQVVNNAVLALKLAKISYDDQGKIVGMEKSGSIEGNYTLGPGTEERQGQTAITVLGSGENRRKGSRLTIRYIGQEKPDRGGRRMFWSSADVHVDQIDLLSILETGKYQHKFHERIQLPLKGLIASKECKHHKRIPWKKKKRERIYLKKVAVTDVEADNTFTCISNNQLEIPKDDWVWLDCRQWRESLTNNEVQVDVKFEGSSRTLKVDAEDPAIVIMHQMRDKVPCHKQVLTHKRRRIMYPANTIKDLGIKDGDQLELESSRDTIPDVWEHITLQNASSAQKISVQKIMSLPFQDIQSIVSAHPELKMDEAKVRQTLQEELSKDEDDDISPLGFQRLMEAVGKKVDLDDILKAIVAHENSFDDDYELSVLDMMTSSLEGKSLFKDGDLKMDATTVDRIADLRSRIMRSQPLENRSWLNDHGLRVHRLGASNVDQDVLRIFRSLSIEEQEYMERTSSDSEAEDTKDDSSQDVGHLEEGKLPGPPKQMTLPTVPGFSEAEVEEASQLLQGLFFKMKSEDPEIAARASEVDWESVNRRHMNWSDVQLSGLDDIAENDKYKALGLLKRQMSGKDKEKEANSMSSVEERVQLGPNLPDSVSSMDNSHGLEKFS
ncbi:uncharacterized protein LOC118430086 [Branchiostoma floridae]|uniref:Uncharacterized protein LOC118430086 n=1 Tax=Branchiostoma floridae TaxID=7739 RepID=A0A9J7MB07_BRAFL|nr:uncharacterized protein LOC118430086 [Branchiostoma floridae]